MDRVLSLPLDHHSAVVCRCRRWECDLLQFPWRRPSESRKVRAGEEHWQPQLADREGAFSRLLNWKASATAKRPNRRLGVNMLQGPG